MLRSLTIATFSVTLIACAAPSDSALPAELRLDVLAQRAHDPTAFTEGLALARGQLLESTGNYGQSEVREVDRVTGDIRRAADLDERYFGEGLAVVGNRIVQL